jgi:hypothetical protein
MYEGPARSLGDPVASPGVVELPEDEPPQPANEATGKTAQVAMSAKDSFTRTIVFVSDGGDRTACPGSAVLAYAVAAGDSNPKHPERRRSSFT